MDAQRSVLNLAYSTADAVSNITLDHISLDNSKAGVLVINGIESDDIVSIYDITGRLIKVEQAATIYLTRGLYVVKVNNVSAKVIIK